MKRVRPQDALLGQPWGTKKSLSFVAYTQSTYPVVTPPTASSKTRLMFDKQKVTSGKANLVNGWRNPTPFQAFICQVSGSGLQGSRTLDNKGKKGKLEYGRLLTSEGNGPDPSWDYWGLNASGRKTRMFGSSGYPTDSLNAGIYAGVSGTDRGPKTSVNTQNRCITEALNKIKDNSLNLGESIATLNQTIGTFTGLFETACKAIHAARKRDVQGLVAALGGYLVPDLLPYRSAKDLGGKRAYKRYNRKRSRQLSRAYARATEFGDVGLGLSNRWLEYQYGWAPLFSDIENVAKRLRDQASTELLVSAKREIKEPWPLPIRPYASYGAWEATGTIVAGAKFRIDMVVTDPGLSALDSVGLVNPLSLGWELLPYSFVVDWLIPFGNFLTGLSASVGLSFKGASLTTWTAASFDVGYCELPTFLSGKLNYFHVASMTTKRVVYSSMVLPRLYYKSPFTSSTRAATALALLHQTLR